MKIQGKSYGMLDYHKYYNKNNSYKLSRKDFSHIVSELNKIIKEILLEDTSDFKLPARTGKLAIRKTKRAIKLIDGKVINTNPPDWQKTKKLWELDPECKEKKILIRHKNIHTAGYVFKIHYLKSNAIFKNKQFYKFKPARQFKRDLTKRINNYVKPKFDSPKSH